MSAKAAYIGLSSPLGYDYEPREELGHPNPILEAPMGLFLLYDEIWFLRPELCPMNMRELEYVRFLSDTADVGDYRERFDKLSEEDILGDDRSFGDMPWTGWDRRIQAIAPFSQYDNHGEGIPEVQATPNITPGNFLFDYFVANEVEDELEYVTNSTIRARVSSATSGTPIAEDILTAERVLTENIPNYQSPEGPYFEEIDDFREYNRRTKFREKILDTDTSADELRDEFDRIRNHLTSQATERGNVYKSLLISVLGRLPGAGDLLLAVEGKEIAQDYVRYRDYGWAGFIAQVESEMEE